MASIPIAEIFGPTVQGEGSLAGRPTYFVRVGGCDFKCAWCDTAYAVNPEAVRGLPRMTQDEIIDRLLSHVKVSGSGPTWLSISGGNPAMYELGDVVFAWQRTSPDGGSRFPNKVTVETQGSKWKGWLGTVDALTISPKPPSSTMINGEDFAHFMRMAGDSGVSKSLKVVVFDDKDYEFAANVHAAYPYVPFYLSCGTAMGGLSGKWVPPVIPPGADGNEWTDKFSTIRGAQDLNWSPQSYTEEKWSLMERWLWLVEKAVADPRMADVAIFPQMHALLWGINTKGV